MVADLEFLNRVAVVTIVLEMVFDRAYGSDPVHRRAGEGAASCEEIVPLSNAVARILDVY